MDWVFEKSVSCELTKLKLPCLTVVMSMYSAEVQVCLWGVHPAKRSIKVCTYFNHLEALMPNVYFKYLYLKYISPPLTHKGQFDYQKAPPPQILTWILASLSFYLWITLSTQNYFNYLEFILFMCFNSEELCLRQGLNLSYFCPADWDWWLYTLEINEKIVQ